MDYETEDLTGKPASFYGAIRLSQVKNPRALNETIWGNVRELEDIVDGVLFRGKTPQALTSFFNTANKGDNINNAVAAGSELGNDSGHLTNRIEGITRKINRYVEMDKKFSGTFPQALVLRDIWEQGRGKIPDMQDVVKKTQIKVESINSAAKALSSSKAVSSTETPRSTGFVFQPLG